MTAPTHEKPATEPELITVDQRATAVDVIDICPDCLRLKDRHGTFTCHELDALEARLAHAQLPLPRRIRARAPEGWRS
jgi:hypothetical protein